MPNALDHEKLSTPLRRILFLLAFSVFINYVDRGNLSIAAPLIKDELGLSPSQLGILLSSFFWTYTAFQIPVGWLVDRFDVSLVLASGFFIWSAATAATGLMHGFAALLAVRLALGIGESVAYPSYSKILARDFSARHRGLGNGAIAAGQTSGPAIGTFFGGILMAQFGWRPFFIVLGCVSLLWLIPWLSWRPANPAPVTVNAANDNSQPARSSGATLRLGRCRRPLLGKLHSLFPAHLAAVLSRPRAKFFDGQNGSHWRRRVPVVRRFQRNIRRRFQTAGSPAALPPRACANRCWSSGSGARDFFSFSASSPLRSWSIALLLASSAIYGISNPNIFAAAQTIAGPQAAGKWMGFQNFVGNFAGIVAPALTGLLVDKTGHFFWPFAVTGIVCLIGSLSWIYIVGPIKPVVGRHKLSTPFSSSGLDSRPTGGHDESSRILPNTPRDHSRHRSHSAAWTRDRLNLAHQAPPAGSAFPLSVMLWTIYRDLPFDQRLEKVAKRATPRSSL